MGCDVSRAVDILWIVLPLCDVSCEVVRGTPGFSRFFASPSSSRLLNEGNVEVVKREVERKKKKFNLPKLTDHVLC